MYWNNTLFIKKLPIKKFQRKIFNWNSSICFNVFIPVIRKLLIPILENSSLKKKNQFIGSFSQWKFEIILEKLFSHRREWSVESTTMIKSSFCIWFCFFTDSNTGLLKNVMSIHNVGDHGTPRITFLYYPWIVKLSWEISWSCFHGFKCKVFILLPKVRQYSLLCYLTHICGKMRCIRAFVKLLVRKWMQQIRSNLELSSPISLSVMIIITLPTHHSNIW